MDSWEEVYKKEGRFFENPHHAIKDLMIIFKERGVKRILDLGSGSGRHTVLIAENGFEVYALDLSLTGVEITQQMLKERKLKAQLKVGNIYERLPYHDDFFDAIISVQTLHHNTLEKINELVDEIERILVKGGYIFVTVPAKMNQATNFKMVEEGTYIPLDGREKGLLHHFFSREEIVKVFSNFNIKKLYIDDVDHYAFLGTKKK